MHPIEDVIAIRFGWSEKHLTIQKKPLSDTQTDVNVKQIRSNRNEWTAEWMSAKMVCLHQSKTKSTLECGRRRRRKKCVDGYFCCFRRKSSILQSIHVLLWMSQRHKIHSVHCIDTTVCSVHFTLFCLEIAWKNNFLWNWVDSKH